MMGGMAKPKLLHIFKPGRWTTMAGESIEFSQADIEASAKAYNPALSKAPLVIGHPRTDDPAKGWAKSMVATAAGLFAEPMQVDAAFAEEVNAGRWGTISAKFYRPTDKNNPVPGVWYPRHIGFLGAQPPAVKGLQDPAFAEGDEDDGCVCFQQGMPVTDWGMETSASLFRRMRDWMLAQFGQATADEVIPDWQIESLREAARQEPTRSTAFSEPEHAPAGASPANPTTEEENHEVKPEEKARLEAENRQLREQLQAAHAASKTAQSAQRRAEHVAFAEQLIGEGRLAPKNKDLVVAFLEFTDSGDTPVEFGEGDAKQPLAAAFKGFLSESPTVVEFGETATKGRAADTDAGKAASVEFAEVETDPDRLGLHVRATSLASEKGIPYEQAVRQLITA